MTPAQTTLAALLGDRDALRLLCAELHEVSLSSGERHLDLHQPDLIERALHEALVNAVPRKFFDL